MMPPFLYFIVWSPEFPVVKINISFFGVLTSRVRIWLKWLPIEIHCGVTEFFGCSLGQIVSDRGFTIAVLIWIDDVGWWYGPIFFPVQLEMTVATRTLVELWPFRSDEELVWASFTWGLKLSLIPNQNAGSMDESMIVASSSVFRTQIQHCRLPSHLYLFVLGWCKLVFCRTHASVGVLLHNLWFPTNFIHMS